MNIEKILLDRCGSVCELCGNSIDKLNVFSVPSFSKDAGKSILT